MVVHLRLVQLRADRHLNYKSKMEGKKEMEQRQYGMDDKLVIKSDKENEIIIAACSLIPIIYIFYFVGLSPNDTYWSFIFAIVVDIILAKVGLYMWIGSARTLIMEKEGCTVCFWRYRKFYAWNELAIKSWQNYKKGGYWIPKLHINFEFYTEGVFFSKYPVKKSKLWMPFDIMLSRNLMSSFWVNFYPYGITDKNGNYHNPPKGVSVLLGKRRRMPEIYPVEKEVFVNYMKLWNVDIEGLSLDIENIRYVSK